MLQLDRVTRFGLWQNLHRVWERNAGLTMRGTQFANSNGDPGEQMFEAMEIIAGQGEQRHWEATKARTRARAMQMILAGRGGR